MKIEIKTEFVSSRDNMLTRIYDFIIPAQWQTIIILTDWKDCPDSPEPIETVHIFSCRTKPPRKMLTRFIRFSYYERKFEVYAMI